MSDRDATNGLPWSEVDRALDDAVRAFAAWRDTPMHERRLRLVAIAKAVRDHRESLALTMARDVGKPIALARGEVERLALTFELAARLLDAPWREELPLDFDARGSDYRCFVERVGVGPVFGIVPYNWPYNLAAHKLAPALAAGNSILWKPSPLARESSGALARLLETCGLPPGVVQMVDCAPDVAERAATDPRVAFVSFTGSERVGWHLRALAPEKPMILELGGDANALVFADADLDWAAMRCATSAFGYAGQVCIALQHVRAQASVYEAFRERLVAATEAIRFGDPLDPDVMGGPLVSDAEADRAAAWIEEAIRFGARVLVGGQRAGRLITPTLLEGVPSSCRLARDEAFAPILVLDRFEDEREAYARVNQSRFGLQASVFTRDAARIEHAFRALEVGGVVVNDLPSLRFDNMPYGGVKRSGLGREGVRYAFEAMTVPKVLLVRR